MNNKGGLITTFLSIEVTKMSKVSLAKAVEFSLKAEGKGKTTLLGVGSMYKTLIKASLLLVKQKDFPMMFITSRNQVDSKELGGGYVCDATGIK